ncbi:receptor-like serine/threonine-protein kinase SD1-8 [Lycium barbarum]|uniref:receptor-like serine/threonine-protein kinase SD1-8 n=1 Tax=Lycium barbarum TaxID=112863 RepID=UPI00293EAB32|nr:receptor-like serine/threonine-protein kinase SD1-8 [Lycium barbarum]XP_060189265.1 receptor-like serine/threonine-protein kinase SD1-8 [Lycium barbarum]XP_060189266.1 receptor-like serine/threonine-protein kinase SD1-8 [Lycium barbarum]XP_060189267.1 receptor-like serine/threonine-protein kinase SD1-8 [Lycium barbarum]XP_060189268.1 receptor-like serine/threonine-protein kinase SD1-8 [Lycium barbarum]XP_060189269.1 receptor-like serine/threonine-protein kinase SD1-8 [Lycium barbarum]
MPEMKLGYNRSYRTTGQRTLINSGTSSEDPQPGNFSFGIEREGHPPFYIWKQNSISYRFEYNNEYSGGNMLGVALYPSVVSGNSGVFLIYGYTKGSVTLSIILSPSRYLQVLAWILIANTWKVVFQAPGTLCDFYAHCGPFDSCEIRYSGLCRCLTGFEPKFSKDWANGKWNGGCARKVALGCDSSDVFLKHESMKVPDHTIFFGEMSIKDCETECIRNSSCTANAYSNSTCLIRIGDLLDLGHNSSTARPLHVRVRGCEPITVGRSGDSAQRHKIFIATIASAISSILVLTGIFAFIFKIKHLRRRGWKDGTKALISPCLVYIQLGKAILSCYSSACRK